MESSRSSITHVEPEEKGLAPPKKTAASEAGCETRLGIPITRIPSVLPDAETSPRLSQSELEAGDGAASGPGPGPELQLQRTTTAPNPWYQLPLWRKCLIVAITSFTALAVTFSSTSLFPLTSEIANSLDTTAQMIQISNALFVFTMGCSSFFWGPVGRLFGRKQAWLGACTIFILSMAGTGLAPNGHGMPVFFAMRIVSGVQGTFFHVAGQTYLADIFEPTQRGTATGFFLVGTVFGPAFGPCIAGIMVTYTSWRAVIWLQTAMMGAGLVASALFLPDIRKANETHQKDPEHRITSVLKEFNPLRILRVFIYPNVLLTDLACGLLAWSQYTLLAAPRHILNPRFHLTTPLVSGLFYIAPGVGFLVGTVIGGRYSDMTVIRWIKRRGGLRLPQDRLNSGMICFFGIVPAASLVYGWGLHFDKGGLALPIVFAAMCAFGLLMAFASLNTYCAEVLPRRRTEVIASKYLVQYIFSSCGSAGIVPMIDAIGLGPATTVGVVFALMAGVLALVTAKNGLTMQRWTERKLSLPEDGRTKN